MYRRIGIGAVVSTAVAMLLSPGWSAPAAAAEIGKEVAVERHLADDEARRLTTRELLDHGRRLFEAAWTVQEGGGRPLTKGTGAPVADPSSPLSFPRNFNRVSAPDANSCAGCHNLPRAGGGGDFVANVFVLGNRFDFATFDFADTIPTRGCMDESGAPAELQTIANSRATPGMFGAGFIEMLARQMTDELIAARDAIPPGGSAELVTKGVSFGTLSRALDGSWDTGDVRGLPASSLVTSGPGAPPNLVIRPFHQVGAVVSLRQFSNGAFNHHHGIQSAERFGAGADPDGDGYADELTRGDLTAVSLWQAQLAVPGRVIPDDPEIEQAVLLGEVRFASFGCAACHVPALPLERGAWVFTEPNPYNPPGNLQPGDAPTLSLDLTDTRLDPPRLPLRRGRVLVPAYTDLRLHDITGGSGDPNVEPLDMHAPAGSPEFFAGNSRFLTKKLWGAANEPPYFHHGLFTTLREAIEAHAGEARVAADAWLAASGEERDAVVEFLKTLQVLPEGTKWLVVNEHGHRKVWPPRRPAPLRPPGR